MKRERGNDNLRPPKIARPSATSTQLEIDDVIGVLGIIEID